MKKIFLFYGSTTSTKFTVFATAIVIQIVSSKIGSIGAQFHSPDDHFWLDNYPPRSVPSVEWNPRLDNLTNIEYPLNVSWSSEVGGRYKEEARRIVASVCGLSRLCNSSGLDPNVYNTDCGPCDECRCDDVCVTYGDCCLDKMFDDVIKDVAINDTPSLLEESSLSSCFKRRVRLNFFMTELPKYRLISSCPHQYKRNDDVKERCINGSATTFGPDVRVKIDDVWTIWPVMSKTSSISYRNLACAECHSDDGDIEYWNVKVACGDEVIMPTGLTKAQTLQRVLDNRGCDLTFEIPQGAEERNCENVGSDFPPPLNACSDKRAESDFDPVLWKMCQTFRNSVRKDYILYSNVFCVLCKEGRAGGTDSRCGTQTGFGYFFMISPSTIQKVVSADQKILTCGCKEDEVLDPVANICRKLSCPQGYNLFHNDSDFRCVDDGTITLGLAYSLNIELTSLNSSVTFDDVNDDDTFLVISTSIKNELFKKTDPVLTAWGTDVNQFITVLYPPQCYPDQDIKNSTEVTILLSAKFLLTTKKSISDVAPELTSLLNTTWNIDVTQRSSGNTLNLSLLSKINPPMEKDYIDFLEIEANNVFRLYISECDANGKGLNLAEDMRQRRQYAEVNNTLTCPYFSLDKNFENYFILDEDPDNSSYVNIKKPILRYNGTGLKGDLYLTMADFYIKSSRSESTTIVCADPIMKYWESVIEERKNDDKVNEFKLGKGLELTSIICLAVSCVCLFITLLTYILFPSLRTLPGKNTMALVANMFLTMIMCLVTPLFDTRTVTCQIVGVANHFFLLSSVSWMVICTYQMYRIFTRIFDHSHGQNTRTNRCFLKYLAVSVIIPALIIAIVIICNHTVNSISKNNGENDEKDSSTVRSEAIEKQTKSKTAGKSTNSNENKNHITCDVDKSSLTAIGYGEGVCYISNELSVLLAAAAPIIAAVVVNCGFFCLTLRSMRKMSQDQKTLRKEPRQQMVIYIKLCALTGLNWIPGLLSVFVDSEILWYAFLLFAGLQGLYVLLAFVCNARVLNMYKEKFCSKGSSPESLVEDHTKESNLSNSTSKDKQGKPAVDDKKNSSQTDEVIICESKLSTPAVHTENQKGGAEFTKL